jgi:hypothetical protein
MKEETMDYGKKPFTAKRVMVKTEAGYCFQFYCALCGRGHTTGWISAANEREALVLAEEESRYYFNRCRKCGKWICDSHYNMDERTCTACAPGTDADINENRKRGQTVE